MKTPEDIFRYQNGNLVAEEVNLKETFKESLTPLFVYSGRQMEENVRFLKDNLSELPVEIFYSMKANYTPKIVKQMHSLGVGIEVVSGGELYIALKSGVPAKDIIYAGNGKRVDELLYSQEVGIKALNVDSIPELNLIAKLKLKLPIGLRINPEVDPKTHPKIATGLKNTKFGIHFDLIDEALEIIKDKKLNFAGLHFHLGSQIFDPGVYDEALENLYAHIDKFREFDLKFIDIGGGLGVNYERWKGNEIYFDIETFRKIIEKWIDRYQKAFKNVRFYIEPGRFLVANAGILITRVLYKKKTPHRNFLVVDAGFNDFGRPSMYEAYHHIEALELSSQKINADVVGPICESGDFLGKDREISDVDEGELLALFDAGAYGRSMSSFYNGRVLAQQYMINGDRVDLISRRGTVEQIIANEIL